MKTIASKNGVKEVIIIYENKYNVKTRTDSVNCIKVFVRTRGQCDGFLMGCVHNVLIILRFMIFAAVRYS